MPICKCSGGMTHSRMVSPRVIMPGLASWTGGVPASRSKPHLPDCEPDRDSPFEQQEACGIEHDVPGLRAHAQNSSKVLGNVCLQMRLVFRSRFRTKSQVECDLMRCFARAYKPARKYVFTGGIIPESDLVRAVSEMSQCLRYRRRGREAATPTGNINEMIAGSGRFDDVFTAGEARSGNRARMLEQFLLRTMCDHVSMIEYKKVRAEAKCLF